MSTTSTPIVARSEKQRSALVTPIPGPFASGSILLCQPDETVVVVAGDRVLNALASGRFVLDAASLPFLAPFVDAASQSVSVTLYFVSIGRDFVLDASSPSLAAVCRVRVEEALHVVTALQALGPQASGESALDHWSKSLAARLAELRATLPSPEAVQEGPVKARFANAADSVLRAAGLTLEGFDTLEALRPQEPARPSVVPTAADPDGLTPLGQIATASQHPQGDRVGALHDDHIPFVMADLPTVFWWRGKLPVDRWTLRRHARAAGMVWPETGWSFATEPEAQAALEHVRQHLRAHYPGATSRVDEGVVALDPEHARFEVWSVDGEDVAWVGYDRTSDALTLAAMTEGAMAFPLAQGRSAVAVKDLGAKLDVSVRASSDGGGFEEIVLTAVDAGAQGVEVRTAPGWVAYALPQPVQLDVPTGLLGLLWGPVVGWQLLGARDGDELVARSEALLGSRRYAELNSPLDLHARGATCAAIRVKPGRWSLALYVRAEGQGLCAVFHHSQVTAPYVPAATAKKKPPPQAWEALLRPGLAEEDTEVFPGEKYGWVSTFSALQRKMQSGNKKAVLDAEGLTPQAYAAWMLRWAEVMLQRPEIAMQLAHRE